MSKIRYALRTAWLVVCGVGVIIVVLNVFVFNKLFGRNNKKSSVAKGDYRES